MHALRNSLSHLYFIIGFFFLSLAQPAIAQSKMPDDISESMHLTNIQWLSKEFGIGTNLEFSKTYPRSDDAVFRFGIEFRKPGIAGTAEKYALLRMFIENSYVAANQKEFEPDMPDSNLFRKVTYEYFVHDSILSLLITDVQSYFQSEALTTYKLIHFDFKNQNVLQTEDIFETYGLSRIPVVNAIAEQCVSTDETSEPFFDSDWFNTIKWNDLNKLKIYMDNENQLVVLYPLIENGTEAKCFLK
jgi:hypothetical protein